jgi:hypothetical protein
VAKVVVKASSDVGVGHRTVAIAQIGSKVDFSLSLTGGQIQKQFRRFRK